MTQLQNFSSTLPKKPYCSNDVKNHGLIIRARDIAIKHKYLQYNKPTSLHWLAFDCDFPGALERAEDNLLPIPNIAIINPDNGNSHLLYELETEVHNSIVARRKPLEYLANIEYSLGTALKADRGFSSLIIKNPLHKDWLTYTPRIQSYDMGELADYLTLPKKLPKKQLNFGLGRRISLFNNLRLWAYKSIRDIKNTCTYEQWKELVLSTCEAFNSFPEPLLQSDIRSISKSIAKWVWFEYDNRDSKGWEEYVKKTHTSEIQRERQKKKVESHNNKIASQKENAKILLLEGMTQKEIAEKYNVTQQTISNWLK